MCKDKHCLEEILCILKSHLKSLITFFKDQIVFKMQLK